MTQTWLVTAFFFALLLLLLYVGFLVLSPFLVPITWALILALLTYPIYSWLERKLRGRSTLAAFLIIAALTLLVIAPGLEIAWFLSDDAVALVKTVRSLFKQDEIGHWSQRAWARQLLGWWDMLALRLGDLKIDWKELLMQGTQATSSFLVSQVAGVAQNVLLFSVNFIVTLFTLFFFLRDGASIVRHIQHLLPMDREHQERLFKNIVDAVTAVVHGSLVVAMVQGLLAGAAYWAVGVPFSVLWGVVTAFMALLPVGGSALVSVPAAIYLFLQGESVRAVILLVWCLGFVGSVDNFLKPMLIGNRLGLPVLFLFFGILGGVALFGTLGIILGPALFALLRALLDLYLQEYAGAKTPPPENDIGKQD
ncbi:MAG: AI-2E family transporter [Deltaproteobacteria bacterium]|nr:AI-2E family transporter [Deltaproteobacteria bacterium]